MKSASKKETGKEDVVKDVNHRLSMVGGDVRKTRAVNFVELLNLENVGEPNIFSVGGARIPVSEEKIIAGITKEGRGAGGEQAKPLIWTTWLQSAIRGVE